MSVVWCLDVAKLLSLMLYYEEKKVWVGKFVKWFKEMDDGENDSEAKVYKSQDSDEIDEREKYFEVDGKLVQ